MNGNQVEPDTEHIFHKTDHDANRLKLDDLYGRVREAQDEWITAQMIGTTVLDVGAGYGSLTRHLSGTGFSVTAIDLDDESRRCAREWHGVHVLPVDIYSTSFADASFDTVILREIVEHLEFDRAMTEIDRLVRRRVLVFETHLNAIVRSARRIAGHEEFNPQTADYYANVLAQHGYQVTNLGFRDVIALPLSGGFVSRQLFPQSPGLQAALLRFDRTLSDWLRTLGVQELFCWRYLLQGDRDVELSRSHK
jgi:2-polyprenyl-3-methyl-5-hydroxy-6-metoxy-1,4-benzoquinol methylase